MGIEDITFFPENGERRGNYMICSRCGHVNDDGSAYCTDCGAQLAGNPREAQDRVKLPPPPPQDDLLSGPPLGTAGYAGPLRQQKFAEDKGFFATLFDFGFTSFLTLRIIKFLYFLIVAFWALVAVFSIIVSFKASTQDGVGSLIAAPLLFLLVTLALRVALELVVLFFRMATDVRFIRERDSFR